MKKLSKPKRGRPPGPPKPQKALKQPKSLGAGPGVSPAVLVRLPEPAHAALVDFQVSNNFPTLAAAARSILIGKLSREKRIRN